MEVLRKEAGWQWRRTMTMMMINELVFRWIRKQEKCKQWDKDYSKMETAGTKTGKRKKANSIVKCSNVQSCPCRLSQSLLYKKFDWELKKRKIKSLNKLWNHSRSCLSLFSPISTTSPKSYCSHLRHRLRIVFNESRASVPAWSCVLTHGEWGSGLMMYMPLMSYMCCLLIGEDRQRWIIRSALSNQAAEYRMPSGAALSRLHFFAFSLIIWEMYLAVSTWLP